MLWFCIWGVYQFKHNIMFFLQQLPMHPCTWIDHFGVFFGFPWNRDKVSLHPWFKLQASSYPQSIFGKVVLLAKSKNILGTAKFVFRSVPPELPAALWPQQRRAHRVLHRQKHGQGKKCLFIPRECSNIWRVVFSKQHCGTNGSLSGEWELARLIREWGHQATVRGLPIPWIPTTKWIQRCWVFLVVMNFLSALNILEKLMYGGS